jgi:uncharacterized protein (TIGR00255 family)
MKIVENIASMTGQAQGAETSSLCEVQVQIKSLNNRFRDYKWKAPSFLSMSEIAARKCLESYFKRGSFDINVNVRFAAEKNANLTIDESKVSAYLQQFSFLTTAQSTSVELIHFLRPEFLKDLSQESQGEVHALLMNALKKCCQKLSEERRTEGQKIALLITTQIERMQNHLKSVESMQGESLENKKNKIQERLLDLKVSPELIDQTRLAQEFVFLAQKLDIQEEIDRFHIHLQKLQKVLESHRGHQEHGKELEFLLQELGREVNTLSSKADHVKISHECVEIKVILESIREQVLNIE